MIFIPKFPILNLLELKVTNSEIRSEGVKDRLFTPAIAQQNGDKLVRDWLVEPARIDWTVWIRRVLTPSNGLVGEIRCTAKRVPLHIRSNAASAIAASAKGGFVWRPYCWTRTQRKGGLGIPNFDPLNDRSGEIRCNAKCVPLHVRGNAASAKARN
ncbi:MAG: hypothetical protein ACI9HB_003085 [Gammaproteobacteria bacterium]